MKWDANKGSTNKFLPNHLTEPLPTIFDTLFQTYGPQHWWPSSSPFEMMLGAILTQHTSWTNVENAIQQLKIQECTRPEDIVSKPSEQLARYIHTAGLQHQKAKRLKAFCRWYLELGGYERLRLIDTQTLRKTLLELHGVGEETADTILLYAFSRPVFVIDVYTRRFLQRLGLINGKEKHENLRVLIETALGRNAKLFNEYHALIVQHGKVVCKVNPECAGCCLKDICAYHQEQVSPPTTKTTA